MSKIECQVYKIQPCILESMHWFSTVTIYVRKRKAIIIKPIMRYYQISEEIALQKTKLNNFWNILKAFKKVKFCLFFIQKNQSIDWNKIDLFVL